MKHPTPSRRFSRAVRTSALGLGALCVTAGAIGGTPQIAQAANAAPSSSGSVTVVGSATHGVAVGQASTFGQRARRTDPRIVRQIQYSLATLGYLNYSQIDGDKGRITNRAIRAFKTDRCQKKLGKKANAVMTINFQNELRSVVKEVQRKAGLTGRSVDGYGGPETTQAIVNYQLAHSLSPDGQAGPATMAKMGIKRRLTCDNPH